jgi:hypothetical protein
MSFFADLKDKAMELLSGHEAVTDSVLDHAREAVDPQIDGVPGEQLDGVVDGARDSADRAVGS